MTGETTVYVIVAALVFMLFGIAICIMGFFFWTMLQQIKSLKATVDGLTKTANEVLGEGSFSRISKSMMIISTSLPELMIGMREFTRVMSIFSKNAFNPDVVPTAVTAPEKESGFYPHSEERAAEFETRTEAKAHNINLTAEQLAGMRTDGQ